MKQLLYARRDPYVTKGDPFGALKEISLITLRGILLMESVVRNR